ncbi:hypothetical protein A9Q87_13510 [Flavobacteriales bacterium 34_180_T64]|nr:hypothetical protein A9Q87_13510 [Flavobacteriales bacterium 34_180_T64]
MLRFISLSITLIFAALASKAQNVGFSPEMVLGHRSLSYQHFVSHSFNEKWSVNNVSYFDTEYNNETNVIFFIRNMLSYSFNKHFKVNAAIGVKNPGAFATITSQYQYSASSYKISYAIGSTHQNGFTLEQTLILNYTPALNTSIKAYLNLFVVVNTNLKILNRGIQQLRIGLKKEKFITGIAINLDQFTKAEKTLENYGIFIKKTF